MFVVSVLLSPGKREGGFQTLPSQGQCNFGSSWKECSALGPASRWLVAPLQMQPSLLNATSYSRAQLSLPKLGENVSAWRISLNGSGGTGWGCCPQGQRVEIPRPVPDKQACLNTHTPVMQCSRNQTWAIPRSYVALYLVSWKQLCLFKRSGNKAV